ncbi:MAG: two component transcriptional regulator, LytTR family [Bacteroidetes bacterium]|nr:two component transcriptional regulator, LytTR family [Bacteroidota bacterium]
MRLKTIIIDDEFLAQQLMETYVKKMSEIHLLKIFGKSKEAFEYMATHPVDLLITDIQMPQINGIDLVNNLSPKPLVIFTTANPQYAVQAFELNVIDFVVKPISYERFENAVSRAVRQFQLVHANAASIEGPFITVKADYKDIKVFLHEIVYMEGWGEYIKIITDTDTIITLHSLKKMEELLPIDLFRRIHKSYIVSLRKVKSHNLSEVVMINKAVVPMGKNFRQDFDF